MIESKEFLNKLKACLRKEKNSIIKVIAKQFAWEIVLVQTATVEANSNLL